MDKKTVIQMLQTDFLRIHQDSEDILKTVHDVKQEALNYMRDLLAQITSTGTTSLFAKTPKVSKKRNTRIKTIPENSEIETSDDGSNLCNSRSSRADTVSEVLEVTSSRSRRGASIKAADIIKKQQAVSLNSKMRRPNDEEGNLPLAVEKVTREKRSKRPKESDSSEEEDMRPVKQSKITKKKTRSKINEETHNVIEDSLRLSKGNEIQDQGKQTRLSVKRKLDDDDEDINTTLTSAHSVLQNSSNDEPSAKKANYSNFSPEKQSADKKKISTENKKTVTRQTRSSSIINAQISEKVNNIINETLDMSNANETIASMYEDAIGKPIPIMNSTMNPNSTVTLAKVMNVTVSLERLSGKKVLNETVTINKNLPKEPSSEVKNAIKPIQEEIINTVNKIAKAPIKEMQASKIPTILKAQRDENIEKIDDLITDDESSPERKEYRFKKEKLLNQQKRITRSNNSMTSDDDEVHRTPTKVIKNLKIKNLKESTLKSDYKQPALFSPYAKDSVKKRVEAFEKVVVSPQQSEMATRVTRTKTRALAAASSTETSILTVSQKLARKSLAKAKKISLAKHARDDDTKENDNTNTVKSKKLSLEKSAQKPSGKTTPLGKSRLQMPTSVTKNTYATPSNSQYYSKNMTGTRGNIVTHIDSFIQSSVTSASKQIDRAAEERRRKANEEDARRKREELLKAQADEKRRKREEKELKNKLAREAKEKQEYEKRLKAEREREEKAKLLQQAQEKQKEEIEKKRLLQQQRMQEKEERRRQEELLRLQRLQEQEEQERLLAEQKRREQEMEKRKQFEMKQQMAEMKLKNQTDKALHHTKFKTMAQKQAPCNYKIDSDPDEEESDDESKPKHQIPAWASKNTRQPQLAMQQYVPMSIVLRFFDAKKCTPDLRDLFHGIDPRKLKRSSSAIWKTPPRYSMMNCSIIKD